MPSQTIPLMHFALSKAGVSSANFLRHPVHLHTSPRRCMRTMEFGRFFPLAVILIAMTAGCCTSLKSDEAADKRTARAASGAARSPDAIRTCRLDKNLLRFTHPTKQLHQSSCLDVLKAGGSRGDGFYFLSRGDGSQYRAYCDMTLEGGGWTLFATKVKPTVRFFTNKFNADSADATDHDAAGCIPIDSWKEVLFRFRSDKGASRVVYSRTLGVPGGGRSEFNSGLQCGKTTPNFVKYTGGFYRHTPHFKKGARDPQANFQKIHLYATGNFGFISEGHDKSNIWIDLWSAKTTHNKYYSVDDTRARGTKCIAGICLLEEPVWVMYR